MGSNRYSQITCYRDGVLRIVTQLDGTIHPDLDNEYIKSAYTTQMSYYNSSQYVSKMIVYYDPEENVLKEYFAQLTKHVEPERHTVVFRCGTVGDESNEVEFETFETYNDAYWKYKSVLSGQYRSLFDGLTKKTMKCPLLFVLVPQQEEPMESEAVLPHDERYTNYELFEDDMKSFTQLFIADYNRTETMRLMKGDLSKTALGYPTMAAIEKASMYLDGLKKIYMNNDYATPLSRRWSNLFHMLIPCYSRDTQLPLIDSLEKIHEKAHLLNALANSAYRKEPTLLYPARVQLVLGRLKYPLVKLDQCGEFSRKIIQAIPHYRRHVLVLMDVFTFDTSNNAGSPERLLWHGPHLTEVSNLLNNGYKDKTQLEFTSSIKKALLDSRIGKEQNDVILFLNEMKRSVQSEQENPTEDKSVEADQINPIEEERSVRSDQEHLSDGHVENPTDEKRSASVVADKDECGIKIRYVVHMRLNYY